MSNSIINLASLLQSSKRVCCVHLISYVTYFLIFLLLRNMETTVWSKARLIKTVWKVLKAILSSCKSALGSFGMFCAFVDGTWMGSCDSSPQSGKHWWIVGNCWYHFETWRKRNREGKCSSSYKLQWFRSFYTINITKLVCCCFCFLCKAPKLLNKRWEEKILARRIRTWY